MIKLYQNRNSRSNIKQKVTKLLTSENEEDNILGAFLLIENRLNLQKITLPNPKLWKNRFVVFSLAKTTSICYYSEEIRICVFKGNHRKEFFKELMDLWINYGFRMIEYD